MIVQTLEATATKLNIIEIYIIYITIRMYITYKIHSHYGHYTAQLVLAVTPN